MPFTLSHPAAALPLRRLLPWCVLSALAIGSMAPDFPYFVGLSEIRGGTHSFASILWYSMPVGLAVYLVFQRWLREPWIHRLPAAFAARIPLARPRASLAAILASLALGAATHVLWDSITHEHEPGVVLVHALNAVLIHVLGFPVRGYKVLQHGSTLAGAALLAYWTLRWLRATPAGALPERWAGARRARELAPIWLALLPGALALGYALAFFPPALRYYPLALFVGAFVVVGVSLASLALLLYAIWWHRGAGAEAGAGVEPSSSMGAGRP